MATSKLLGTASLFLVASLASAQGPAARMETWLQPADPLAIRTLATAKTTRTGPAAIENPAPSLKSVDAFPPPIPAAAQKAIRPRTVAESLPFAAWFGEPTPPAPIKIPEGALVTQTGTTAEDLRALPILGQYARDQVSLGDPSGEVSMSLILRPKNPERVGSAPFEAWNLPDPLQNARVVRLRMVWNENETLPMFIAPPTGR
jgi:hypothetical protein